MSNFFAELEAGFEASADQLALILSGQEDWTYAALLQQINRAAGHLMAFGVNPGDRVLVQVPKSPENLALYLACLKLGLVYVPLNTGYTAAELDYFVSDAEPVLYVGEQHRSDVVSATLQPRDAQRLLVFSNGEGLEIDAVVPPTVTRSTDDLAAILYTSGTTGRSKGAMLSHGNLASNAHALSKEWGWQSSDVLLNALPIFHVHGLFIASHCALLNATPMIFLEKFDADEVMARLPDATVMMGVPTYYTRLLADPRFNRDISGHMRLFISGSAPLLVETSDEFFDRTGQRILERYGMTETGMSCSNPLNGDRRAGSVGPPLPGVEVRIIAEDGSLLPYGEVGLLEVKGDHVFKGYWKLPEKTAAEFKGDWFITGDMATLSEDGYVSIVGRGKDLIISGGLNIYPKEIEDVLNDQAGVIESAVVGVPHPDFGEGIVAVLVGEHELDMDALQATCREKLAGFKVPRRWIQLDTLPRNTMGKVQKNLLRDDYTDSFK